MTCFVYFPPFFDTFFSKQVAKIDATYYYKLVIVYKIFIIEYMEWIKQHGLYKRKRDRAAFEELQIQL